MYAVIHVTNLVIARCHACILASLMNLVMIRSFCLSMARTSFPFHHNVVFPFDVLKADVSLLFSLTSERADL